MNKTVFEAKGEALIGRAGMTKTEFARRMGIQKQNVKALFRSPKLDTVRKVADVLGLPLDYLIGYVNPIDLNEEPFVNFPIAIDESFELEAGEVPMGDSEAERAVREDLVHMFLEHWLNVRGDVRVYNDNLKEFLDLSRLSVEHTALIASRSYFSTISVLQLGQVLEHAKSVGDGARGSVDRAFLMKYSVVGVGRVRLNVLPEPCDSGLRFYVTSVDCE